MGEIENASGVGTVGNAKCGDIMKIYLKILLILARKMGKSIVFGQIYKIKYLMQMLL